MKKNLFRLLALALIATASIVACGNDTPACAAADPNNPRPPRSRTTVGPARPKVTVPPRATSTIAPKATTSSSTAPGATSSAVPARPTAKTTITDPKKWNDDRVNSHNWNKPYRKGVPTAPRPTLVVVHNTYYRTYNGYDGYYLPGTYPIGYGELYGCRATEEVVPYN